MMRSFLGVTVVPLQELYMREMRRILICQVCCCLAALPASHVETRLPHQPRAWRRIAGNPLNGVDKLGREVLTILAKTHRIREIGVNRLPRRSFLTMLQRHPGVQYIHRYVYGA